jgi:hypothetical protein
MNFEFYLWFEYRLSPEKIQLGTTGNAAATAETKYGLFIFFTLIILICGKIQSITCVFSIWVIVLLKLSVI